jgi:hypothetical protein
MGVQHYLALWGVKHTPKASYAPNDRDGFYEWIYKGNIGYNDDGSAFVKEVPVPFHWPEDGQRGAGARRGSPLRSALRT